MEISEKIKLVNVLNELVMERELVVFDLKTEELLSGEDIRIVCMKGDAIYICLSGSISESKAKSGEGEGAGEGESGEIANK